jgi:hypothetical protein
LDNIVPCKEFKDKQKKIGVWLLRFFVILLCNKSL